MIDRSRIFFGYLEQDESEVIVFPQHEEVFAREDLYLSENDDLSEEANETIYSARIIPTISFPLHLFDPDWQGRGYFFFQANIENDFLQYSLDKSGKIKSLEPLHRCKLYEDLGDISFEELQNYLNSLRIRKGGFVGFVEDHYPVLAPDVKDFRRFEDYELSHQEWQSAYNQYNFPKKPAYRDKGHEVVRLGCAPYWIQGIQETPEDSQHNLMEYLGSMYQFHIGLTGIYSYLFYSPFTQEFVQIDQMT